ncbi:MAG: non-canonical purine NTP diphosphatase [Flavobacteriales bacterium]|nr:non-canonical purine NTP diphosphatase [Flavobacteriales bacterium]
MKIVIATNNKNKFQEIRELLPDSIELVTLSDIGCLEDIPETADTLEGNAAQKTAFVLDNYAYDCFADDTGLEVDALNGAPGVYSARYAGEKVTYDDNVNKMLKEMKGKEDRCAQFRTVISLKIDGMEYFFEGSCEGEITEEKHGEGGFGYDPIFKPKGYDITFSEMSLDEKGKISHRGLAVAKLVEFLEEYSEAM